MQKSILVKALITSMMVSQISIVSATSNSSELTVDTGNITQIQSTGEIIENIKKQDPAQFIPNNITTDQGKFISEQKLYNISMDIDTNAKNVVFKKNNIALKISMPNQKSITLGKNHAGQVISKEKYYDIIIQSIDGGIRYILNINSQKADKSYDFKMDIPTGYQLTQDKNGNVSILDASGSIYATIAKPWAKDANGKEVNTWYTIKGSILTQYVDFDKNSIFPIIADPIWCGQTIASTSWIYRGGTHPWSLSVEPTACGAWISRQIGDGQYSWQSWLDLLDKTPVSIRWDKVYGTSVYWSMYDQFQCHTVAALGYKTPWNLEPTRPNVGRNATLVAYCNP